MSTKGNVMSKVVYTEAELLKATDIRKRIADLTGEQWCEEWDRICEPFRKAAEINRKIREEAEKKARKKK